MRWCLCRFVMVRRGWNASLFILTNCKSAQNYESAGGRQDTWELYRVRLIWHNVRSKLDDHMEWKQTALASWDRLRTTVHRECLILRHLEQWLPRRLMSFQNHYKWECHCLNPVVIWWNHSLNPLTVSVASIVSIYSNFWREWVVIIFVKLLQCNQRKKERNQTATSFIIQTLCKLS